MAFTANQAVYCRRTGAMFTLVSCNAAIALLSDGTTRTIAELTGESMYRRGDEGAGEYAERVDAAEATAGRYFADATKPQATLYNDALRVIAPYKGSPRWDRERAAIERKYRRTTLAAAELANLTFAELMTAGEVSEELNDRWDALAASPAVMQAAE